MNDMKYRTISKCRSCGSQDLLGILSLGDLYVSDFVGIQTNKHGIQAPLDLVLCNATDGGCGLLQLKHTVPSEALYGNYWYRSGINKTMTDELNDIARKVSELSRLKDRDFVIDIGANDGTLLRGYRVPGLSTIGFEPAQNLKSFNEQGTTKIISDYFSHHSWRVEYGDKRAKAITAIGMFYDLDEPNIFVSDIERCLDDEGVLVIQMMYLPFVIQRNAFDGICHEHLEYYSLFSLENLLARHFLEIFDVEMREEINEGSIRVYVRKTGKGHNLKIQDGASKRISELRERETSLGLNDKKVYKELEERVLRTKTNVVDFIKCEVAKGKVVHGYAASTKGNTTLQFYGLDSECITAIAERNSAKVGKYTIGSLIPIISEEDSRLQHPDYYFALAWHFLPEFIAREQQFLKGGGKFIVPMPEFRLIGA